MPNIETASVPITSFPNIFISPFGNDNITPLYSSVPLLSTGTCLPCVTCGNSVQRNVSIQNAASKYPLTQKTQTIAYAT